MSNDIITQPSTDHTATPPAMPDPRPLFARAAAIGRDILAGVRAEQLDGPTPCTEFDVRTLAGHLVAVVNRLAVVGAGGDPFTTPLVVSADTVAEMVAAYDGYLADLDAVWKDDAVLTRMLTLPWAQLPGAIAMMIYVNEVTVHSWDLATATGQTPAWDDSVVGAALAAIQRGLPDDQRAEAPFDPVQPVAVDATLIERLVAWNGRRP